MLQSSMAVHRVAAVSQPSTELLVHHDSSLLDDTTSTSSQAAALLRSRSVEHFAVGSPRHQQALPDEFDDPDTAKGHEVDDEHQCSGHGHGHGHGHSHSHSNAAAAASSSSSSTSPSSSEAFSKNDMVFAEEDDVEISEYKRSRMMACGKVFIGTYAFLVAFVHIVSYLWIVQFMESVPLLPFAYVTQALSIFCYIKATIMDPGFLPPSSSAYKLPESVRSSSLAPSARQIEHAAKYGLRFCSTCQIIRPLRAKHCKFCNRCVARFDHHCPFIANCVGARNNPFFSAMILFQAITLIIGALIVVQVMVEGIHEPKYYLSIPRGLVFSLLCLLFIPLFLVAVGFSLFSLYRIAYNITTNEQANHSRYNYIFMNPYFNRFDKGILNNCKSFWSFADDKPLRSKV